MRHATGRAERVIRGRITDFDDPRYDKMGPSVRFCCGEMFDGHAQFFGDTGAVRLLIGIKDSRTALPDCPKCRVAIDHALEFPDAAPLTFGVKP